MVIEMRLFFKKQQQIVFSFYSKSVEMFFKDQHDAKYSSLYDA
jgi:hypothetical protein